MDESLVSGVGATAHGISLSELRRWEAGIHLAAAAVVVSEAAARLLARAARELRSASGSLEPRIARIAEREWVTKVRLRALRGSVATHWRVEA
jgi:hypothetical protein